MIVRTTPTRKHPKSQSWHHGRRNDGNDRKPAAVAPLERLSPDLMAIVLEFVDTRLQVQLACFNSHLRKLIHEDCLLLWITIGC
jgi:hypothetical protein